MKKQLNLLKLSEKKSKEVKAGFAAGKRDLLAGGNNGWPCPNGKLPTIEFEGRMF